MHPVRRGWEPVQNGRRFVVLIIDSFLEELWTKHAHGMFRALVIISVFVGNQQEKSARTVITIGVVRCPRAAARPSPRRKQKRDDEWRRERKNGRDLRCDFFPADDELA